MNIAEINEDIDRILYPYLAINSETGTEGEKEAETYLLNVIGSMEYFQENPNCYGAFQIPKDHLDRSVCWGLIRGSGERTVILLHHYDVVNVEDFKTLKNFAFLPNELEKELLKMNGELHPEVAEDLASGEYLFGKGTADMKAGGAIQLALLDRYSKEKNLKGNILLIALPDEENLSAGMRGAVLLLSELRQKLGLHYVYAINSEPHQRKDKAVGLLSEGSVGKLLAFVYVRGFLSHVGKVFEGLNPLAVLTRIAVRTELSQNFSDIVHGEASPPPTWLYLRDRKQNYDVSIPLGAGGCVSILTLDSDPASIMDKLIDISQEAFSETIREMNESFETFCRETGRERTKLPWKMAVCTFEELLREARENHGQDFSDQYAEKLRHINNKIIEGKTSLIEASFTLTEFVYEHVNDLSPRVVIGLVPPYYPSVSNTMLSEGQNTCPKLAAILDDFAHEKFGQRYDSEFYFTGISDLSYLALRDSGCIEAALQNNMPLYGEAYSIPLSEIETLSIPCMNIGPWGKDFHKLSERVYKPDLYERTPALIVKAIEAILEK